MSETFLTSEQEKACRGVIAEYSHSFHLSSRLLPPAVRHAAWALYGFCRTADDAVDCVQRGADPKFRVADQRARLDAIYSGRAQSLLDESFLAFVERFDVPRSLPECMLDGFETDADGPEFSNQEDLLQYCFQVASTVGLMMTFAMDAKTEQAFMRASDLGIAMQLTNIARDMGEDLANGRIYVPSSWSEEAGETLQDSDVSVASPLTRALTKRLLDLAERHYKSADSGIPLLPMTCRWAIASARHVYGGIQDAVAQNDYDNISWRAFVPYRRKLYLVLLALGRSITLRKSASGDAGPSDAMIEKWLEQVGLLAPSMKPGNEDLSSVAVSASQVRGVDEQLESRAVEADGAGFTGEQVRADKR